MKSIEAAADTGGLTVARRSWPRARPARRWEAWPPTRRPPPPGACPGSSGSMRSSCRKAIRHRRVSCRRGDGRATSTTSSGQSARQRDRVPAGPRRPDRAGAGARPAAARAASTSAACTASRTPSRTSATRRASAPRWARRSSRTTSPTTDAIFVERIKRAGAIIIGKTNTPEFGLGSQTYNTVFGTTLNAYDQTRTAGGSSGGAAVGAGAAHAAGRRRQRLHGLAAQPGRVEQRLRLPAVVGRVPGRSHRRGRSPRLGVRRPDGRAP